MRVPRPTIENKGVLGFLVWGELDNAQRDVRTAYFSLFVRYPVDGTIVLEELVSGRKLDRCTYSACVASRIMLPFDVPRHILPPRCLVQTL